MQSVQFVMDRDFTIKGFGHSIAFRAGEPRGVPPDLHAEALRCGAKPLDNGDAVAHVAEPPKPAPAVVGHERTEKIIEAMDYLVEHNQRMSFGADGLPTTRAIFRITGFDLERNERNAAWAIRQERIRAEKDPSNITMTKEAEAKTAPQEKQKQEEVAETEPVKAEQEEKPAPAVQKKVTKKKVTRKKVAAKKA